MTNKEEQVELAKLAEQAERYTDMVASMKKVAESNSELTIEERNLLSVAYKNVIGTYRAPWRAILTIEQKGEVSERKQQMTKEYHKKIENEMKDICHELLTLLDRYLIQKATAPESKIFYLKMKGDYYRYLAEITTGDERQKMADASYQAYENALDLAKNQLPGKHPIRLGLVLNFSVFYYEILNKPDVACRLAKQAFDDALAELYSIDEDSYQDSQLILQLLRDNITVDLTERCLLLFVIVIVFICQYVQNESTDDKSHARSKKQLEELDEVNEEKRENELAKPSKANQFLTYEKCIQRMKYPASREEECSEECKAGNTEEEVEEHNELTMDEQRTSLNKAAKRKYESNINQKKHSSKSKHSSTSKTDL